MQIGIVTKVPPCVARLQVVRDGRCHGPEITPGLKLSASFWQSILFSSDSETFGSSRLTLSLWNDLVRTPFVATFQLTYFSTFVFTVQLQLCLQLPMNASTQHIWVILGCLTSPSPE